MRVGRQWCHSALGQTTLETEKTHRIVREPEIVLHDEKLEELGMFNWKRRKLRDLNVFRNAMKKKE